MKTSKIVILCGLILLIIVGECGCVKMGKDSPDIDAISYLNAKYNQEFSFSKKGDDVWSSKTTTAYYLDNTGVEFSVKKTGDMYSDNYLSFKYDDEAQDEIKKVFSNDLKLFVSTKDRFFSSSHSFDSLNDYLKGCSTINIAIYSKNEVDKNNVVSQLKEYNSEIMLDFLVIIYHIDEQEFNQIDSYGSNVEYSSILSQESFYLNGNELKSKSWQ